MKKNKLIFDIGTNSIKFYFYSFQYSKWEILRKGKFENRLGEGFNDSQKEISDQVIVKSIDKINKIINETKYDDFEVIAFGTEIFRTASNAQYVLDYIKKETNLSIQILTQKEELEVYWKGVVNDFEYDGLIAAIDIGGGSVQFMYGDKKGLQGSFYLKTGALFLRNQFIKAEPPMIGEYTQIENYINKQIEGIKIQFPPNTPFIHGSSSVIDFYTEAKLNLVPYNNSLSHPYKISLKDTYNFYKKLRTLPRKERIKYFPSEPYFTDGASIGMANVLLIAEKTGLTYEIPSNNNIINGFL